MNKNIIFNISLKEYKKKYRHNKANLLTYTKNEVKLFDKFNKPYVKDYVLKGRKWALIGDTYYEIPKAPKWTWFRNINPAARVCTYALVLGALGGGGYGVYSYLSKNNGGTPSPYKDIIVKVDEMNSMLAESKDKFSYPKLAVDYLKDKKQIQIDTLKTGNDEVEYGYNLANNEIVLVGTKDEQVKYSKTKTNKTSDVWRFKDTYTLSSKSCDQTYGTYLRKTSSLKTSLNASLNKSNISNDKQIEITFNSNLDVGENKNCKLLFDSTTVTDIPIIATNYGDLEVKGSLDSISHYGVLNSLTIDSLKGDYNEYGTVADKVIIRSGTFNAKDNALVNSVYADGKSIKITIDEKVESVGTVCFTKDDYKEIKIEYIGTVTEEQKPDVKKEAITPPGDDDILNGFGTLKSPYTFKDMIKAAPKITEKYANYSYFVYTGTQKEIDGSSWAYNGKEMDINGQLDCKGLTINNIDSYFINHLGVKDDFTNLHSVSNLTLNCNISSSSPECAVVRTVGMKAELNNITVHGVIVGSGAAAFCGFGANNFYTTFTDTKMELAFNNCYSDATLISTNTSWATVGCFIMKSHCRQDDSLITINDSIFLGNVFYPDSANPNIYVSYCAVDNRQCVWMKTNYSNEFISKYGNPEGTLYPVPNKEPGTGRFQAYKGTSSTSEYKCEDLFMREEALNKITYKTSSKKQATSLETLEKIEVQKVSGASYATATLYIAPNDQSGNGAYIKPFETEDAVEIDKEGTKYYSTENIKNFFICINKDSSQVQEFEYNVDDGGTFYHRPGDTGEAYKWAYITITQFNENDLPIYISHINLTLE